ncbi:hypothetical protein QFC22_003107 [Naganishia vaughanmartiniae]|uniref:Uncharacterized protein n=1 Tax=Naganishia vaughanmartiniae TaxID=1424756 RepID=A0ACC2XA77_9TREE|nr:hypothetical protein QFC22_003107 [Naganishia vaughanmartiniae]
MQSVKIVEAVTKHTGTVIFLHVSSSPEGLRPAVNRSADTAGLPIKGLGDTGASFVPLAGALQQKHPHVRFVFPTAKPKPISINNGYLMPAWYDVENMNRDRLADSIEDDEESMMNSVAVVDSLIEKEVTEQGINEDRIVIGGFSQGCVVTTLSSLILKRKLAGLIALSGWLALSHKIEELISPTGKDLAVFWGHGKQDRVIEHRCAAFSMRSSAERF